MEMWTIYDSPDDFPGTIVLRKFLAQGGVPAPEGTVILCPSVEAARRLLPPGLACFPRAPSDPPSVVETWL